MATEQGLLRIGQRVSRTIIEEERRVVHVYRYQASRYLSRGIIACTVHGHDQRENQIERT